MPPPRFVVSLVFLSLIVSAPIFAEPYDDGFAAYDDGFAAYNRGDFSTALRLWRPLAERGDSRAQNGLGRIYDDGEAGPQDYVEAVRWYRMAAEQGYAYGENNLGVMYYQGHGVPQDYVQAMKWCRKALAQGNDLAPWNINLLGDNSGVLKADPELRQSYRDDADKGDPDAQYAIGLMYLEGRGEPQDYVQAHMWLNLAASASGFYVYTKKRDDAAARMTPAQIAEAQKLAREWKPK
jgi:TPR repeat protein